MVGTAGTTSRDAPRTRPSVTVVKRWRSVLASLGPRRCEVLVIAFLLVAIQVAAFADFYRGTASPGGDFFGTYNTVAFAWWRDGGLFDPPEWLPYIWGGFPAAAQVQNSGWYLPTGIMAWLTPFDIRAAATLQALHVAFGGLGVYVLARRGGFGRSASAVGLVAFSFVTGFFTEAPYVDIVRGFALTPWILLCLSPLWPWRRRWAVPLAALLLWQAAVGVYPGMLVAIGYVGVVWALGWQVALRPRLRDFLLRLACAGAIAVALTLDKLLPQLVLQTIARGTVEDVSLLSPVTFATLVLPGYPDMPGVYTVNLLFVPAAAVILATLAQFRRPIMRVALAAAGAALLLALPIPALHAVTDGYPGVSSSRFRLNDYYPLLALLCVVAAVAGVERLQAGLAGRSDQPRAVARALLACGPLALGVAALAAGSFRLGTWVPTFTVLVVTTVVVLAALAVPHSVAARPVWRAGVAGLLTVLAAASGLAHADTARHIWHLDTVAVQETLWGETSTELIRYRTDDANVRRPARIPLEEPISPESLDAANYHSTFYTGAYSVAGSFTVRDSPSRFTSTALLDPARSEETQAFWEAAGALVPDDAGEIPPADDAEECLDSGACGVLTVEPVSYSAGHLVYDLTARNATSVHANETYYEGWHVALTGPGGRSTAVAPRMGTVGEVVFDVPAGSWRVSLVYETPLASPARALFDLGFLALLAPFLPPLVVRYRGRRREATPSGP